MATPRIIVIPARMESERFPDKPLYPINGRPLIDWTLERAWGIGTTDQVIVATDSRAIVDHVRSIGGTVVYDTERDYPTGTHRVWGALDQLGNIPARARVINWQVDEPCVDSWDVSMMFRSIGPRRCPIITLIGPLPNRVENDPHMVKVLVGDKGRCLWFARHEFPLAHSHIGIYGFDYGVLCELAQRRPTALSHGYRLEQLAWLEQGYKIYSRSISATPPSVNVPDDISRVERCLKS